MFDTIEKRKNILKIRNMSIVALVLAILGIALLVASIFATKMDINNIISNNENNPFIALIKNPSLFFKETNNIIFIALFGVGLLFFYLGSLVIPTINVFFAKEIESKSLFTSVLFGSPLCLVIFPIFPLVWLIANISTLAIADKLAKECVEENEEQATEPMPANVNPIGNIQRPQPTQRIINNSLISNAPQGPNGPMNPTTMIGPRPMPANGMVPNGAHPQMGPRPMPANSMAQNGAHPQMGPRPMQPGQTVSVNIPGQGPRPMQPQMGPRPMQPGRTVSSVNIPGQAPRPMPANPAMGNTQTK